MKFELFTLRLLFVILAVAMFVTGLHFLSTIPSAEDKFDAILCTVLTLGTSIVGSIAAVFKGAFDPIEDAK